VVARYTRALLLNVLSSAARHVLSVAAPARCPGTPFDATIGYAAEHGIRGALGDNNAAQLALWLRVVQGLLLHASEARSMLTGSTGVATDAEWRQLADCVAAEEEPLVAPVTYAAWCRSFFCEPRSSAANAGSTARPQQVRVVFGICLMCHFPW
jgi:hypothetical protein